MFVIFGEKLYGTVSQVPGVGHIATVFFHIFFFPVAPFRSYIVVTGSSPSIDDAIERGSIRLSSYGFWGVRIPLSFRSVFFGYVRGLIGLVVVWMATGVGVFLVAETDKPAKKSTDHLNLILCSIGVGGCLLFWLSRRLTRASEVQAAELLEALQLDVEPAHREPDSPQAVPRGEAHRASLSRSEHQAQHSGPVWRVVGIDTDTGLTFEREVIADSREEAIAAVMLDGLEVQSAERRAEPPEPGLAPPIPYCKRCGDPLPLDEVKCGSCGAVRRSAQQ